MTLLQQIHEEQLAHRESERMAARAVLRRALTRLFPPGTEVIVFGSIVAPGRFGERSDVDLALVGSIQPRELTRMAVALEQALNRTVDLVVLEETREKLREKILREGEPWIV